jgi:hypothetical protein
MISCSDHPIAKVESGEWGDTYPSVRPISSSIEGKFEAYIEKITYGSIDADLAKANALFIVKAVNSHDMLVRALRDILNAANDPYEIARNVLSCLRNDLANTQG